MPNHFPYEELYRLEKYNNKSILRISVLDGQTLLIMNDLVTNEAVSIDLSKEEIVQLGKGLIRAWEYPFIEH